MIPQSTTLQERLEFYEWAFGKIKRGDALFICWLGGEFYGSHNFGKINLQELFPELYELRTQDRINLWFGKHQRIEALQKAIIEVKRKIEEDESNRQMA